MKTYIIVMLTLLMVHEGNAQNKIPSRDVQIKIAKMAAPQQFKDGATVYGYSEKGEWTLLKEGNNDMICISDDPQSAGLNVSCYHKDLDTFMERGRELKKEGKTFREIFDIREEEAKSGKLKMPKDGVTLFVYAADEDDFNPATGEVINGQFRYVVYIPYATVESTGLPLSPEAPGMPWIMDPETHRAHIMITPPKNSNSN
ncbi:hypothetical protein [Anditalea andensis]|uniref:Uncharacterized protein n=1 Tax=Anditalea andensis TaxID=1048983 RepID=A0A074L287_9BACT|nr:hypothetical protein [Anditalea andensis]KEO73983.1 hypothetical protein EL17_07465 [Anditalea andensis]